MVEAVYMNSLSSGKISGDGKYTKMHRVLKDIFEFEHSLLTTSCTAALEMCAANVPGDEVIMPALPLFLLQMHLFYGEHQ